MSVTKSMPGVLAEMLIEEGSRATLLYLKAIIRRSTLYLILRIVYLKIRIAVSGQAGVA
jgi:hypothetical protein